MWKIAVLFPWRFLFLADFLTKKVNAENGILSGYFSQNIPSHDLQTAIKSNWHGHPYVLSSQLKPV